MDYTFNEISDKRYEVEFEDGTKTIVSVAESEDEIADLVSFYLNPPELVALPSIPQTVTMAQARIALKQAGLFDTINDGLNAMPDGAEKDAALTAWEYAPHVSRNGALVTTLSSSFGLTGEDLDGLFIAADAIEL